LHRVVARSDIDIVLIVESSGNINFSIDVEQVVRSVGSALLLADGPKIVVGVGERGLGIAVEVEIESCVDVPVVDEQDLHFDGNSVEVSRGYLIISFKSDIAVRIV